MSNDNFKELLDFLEQAKPAFNRFDQRQYASELRGGKTANWLDNFLNTIQPKEIELADPSIDKTTGIKHTVESMVQELQRRVCLDVLNKTASVALSKRSQYKSNEADLDELPDNKVLELIKDEVMRKAIEPTSGYVDTEVLLNIVKEKFGNAIVERFGREELVDFLGKLRDSKLDKSQVDALPKYDGSPISADSIPPEVKTK